VTPRTIRLTRVQDRFALSADSAPWTINPRTKFLETRAPLTWTGVRPYRQPDGVVLRVLHRPEQWEAPEPLRRLRCLTATQGHPRGDVNVSPANEAELRVGYTGDDIRVETIDGYRCPTARVTVTRPETIKRIQDGATQTSLGYTALWVGPPDDEMTVDPATNKACGVWQGPNGPELYDLEHIVDPDCELVREVVKAGKAGFDPDQLGPNHHAIALDSGRGGVQSELMRVVDSVDLGVESDVSTVGRLVEALSNTSHETLRELALECSDSNTPIVPDPTSAVLDSSYPNPNEQSARDSSTDPRTPAMTNPTPIPATATVHNLAISRDLAVWLASHKLPVPAPVKLTVRDEGLDMEKLLAFVQALEENCAGMREMMGGMETQLEDAGTDKAALEEKVKLAEEALTAAQTELGSASDAMKKACDALVVERDALKTERDSLLTEVSPLRTAELDRVRSIAVKAGVAKDEADKLGSIAELRRATVIARCPSEAKAFRDASDESIALTYRVVTIGFTGPAGVVADATETKTAPMPSPKLGPAQDQPDPAAKPDKPSVGGSLAMLGGKPSA
jgi:hypothetical protein